MSECEHQYRRDVETCPYCELNEAEENLGVAERANTMHIEALETCRLERDEARERACRFHDELWELAMGLRAPGSIEERREEEAKHSWLKKQASVDEEEGDTVT